MRVRDEVPFQGFLQRYSSQGDSWKHGADLCEDVEGRAAETRHGIREALVDHFLRQAHCFEDLRTLTSAMIA
jgi:hypothetical protein